MSKGARQRGATNHGRDSAPLEPSPLQHSVQPKLDAMLHVQGRGVKWRDKAPCCRDDVRLDVGLKVEISGLCNDILA